MKEQKKPNIKDRSQKAMHITSTMHGHNVSKNNACADGSATGDGVAQGAGGVLVEDPYGMPHGENEEEGSVKEHQSTTSDSKKSGRAKSKSTSSTAEGKKTPARAREKPTPQICEVSGCAYSAKAKACNMDEYGAAGRRCLRHGGGVNKCDVEGCAKSTQGKKITRPDQFGGIGFRCARHGGEAMCVVSGCTWHSISMLTQQDQWGPMGWRCQRHGGKHGEKAPASTETEDRSKTAAPASDIQSEEQSKN